MTGTFIGVCARRIGDVFILEIMASYNVSGIYVIYKLRNITEWGQYVTLS